MKAVSFLPFGFVLLVPPSPVAGQHSSCAPDDQAQPVLVRLSRPTVVFVWPMRLVSEAFPGRTSDSKAVAKDLAWLRRERRFREQCRRVRGDLESAGVAVLDFESGKTRLLAFHEDGFDKTYDLRQLQSDGGVVVFCPGVGLEVLSKRPSDSTLRDRAAECTGVADGAK